MKRQAQPTTPNRPGRPSKEGLREHLLITTLQLLLRDGYEKFSMNAVAVAANASKETLYRHFIDKAGLLNAALDHIGQLVEPLLMRDITDELDSPARLHQLAQNYLNGCLLPESIALQRIAFACIDPVLGDAFAHQFTDAALAFATQQMEQIGTPNPPLDAEVFLGMTRALVHERALLGVKAKPGSNTHAALSQHAVHVFLGYLANADSVEHRHREPADFKNTV